MRSAAIKQARPKMKGRWAIRSPPAGPPRPCEVHTVMPRKTAENRLDALARLPRSAADASAMRSRRVSSYGASRWIGWVDGGSGRWSWREWSSRGAGRKAEETGAGVTGRATRSSSLQRRLRSEAFRGDRRASSPEMPACAGMTQAGEGLGQPLPLYFFLPKSTVTTLDPSSPVACGTSFSASSCGWGSSSELTWN